MRVELLRGVEGVNVETAGRKTSDRGPHQFAAKGQHQAIIGHRVAAPFARDDDLASGRIDRFDLGNPVLHPDGIEQLCKRNRRLAKLDLVIAHADVVIGMAIDDENFDVPCPCADPVAFARGAERGPEPGKTGTEHKNTRHSFLPIVAAASCLMRGRRRHAP